MVRKINSFIKLIISQIPDLHLGQTFGPHKEPGTQTFNVNLTTDEAEIKVRPPPVTRF